MTMDATEVFQQTARRIAEKVARFEKLLRDPELAPYISALRNGDLPQPAAAPVPQKARASEAGARSGIRDAIRSLKGRLPREFTAEHIARELQRKDFAVAGKKPEKTIQNTLFKLSQRREIKRVKSGAGGQSNTYVWTVKK